MLKRPWKRDDGKIVKTQLVVPRVKVVNMTEKMQRRKYGAVIIINKTLERFYWADCDGDMRDWNRKCSICAFTEGPRSCREMKKLNDGLPFGRTACRAAVQGSIVHTSTKGDLGRAIKLFCDLAFESPSIGAPEVGECAGQLRK